jgi:hypothetical protein
LARLLENIAGPDPEPLQPAQRHDDALQIGIGDRGLLQHLDVAFVHDTEPVAQITTPVGESGPGGQIEHLDVLIEAEPARISARFLGRPRCPR